MLRKLTFTVFALFVSCYIYSQSGTLQGTVKDPETGELVPFANVTIERDGTIITGGTTDFDGKYVIKPIPAGKYNVKCSCVGYNTSQVNGVVIKTGSITFQDFKLATSATLIAEVEVVEYKVPLIDKDQTSSGGTVTSEDIAKMPGRSAASVATTVGGVYSENGEVGSIRGAREEGTVYYIDGVKVRGSNSLPKSAIEQVSVITGGLPAQYGDATGGIISVVTKGPSQEYYGGIELASSHFLDAFDYNLLGFNVSGPLLSIKDKKDSTKRVPIMGFLFAGELNYTKDDDPSAIGMWRAKDEVIDSLIANPLRESGLGFGSFLNAEFLDTSAFYKVKAKQNVANKSMNLSAKIDISPSRNLNITLGASMTYINQHAMVYSFSLFNSENNPQQIYSSWRAYARLTQKFTNYTQVQEDAKSSIFKNPYYSIQADYSKTNSTIQDDTHKDNLFNYGYVGKYETHQVNSYSWGVDTTLQKHGLPYEGYVHDGFRDTIVIFTPSDINEEASIYSENFFDMYDTYYYYQNFDIIRSGGGIVNGEMPGEYSNNKVYGIWDLPGVQYNGYSKSENTQFRLSATGYSDIKNHEVSLGFEFEQRTDRYYGVSPINLWTLGRSLINNHIIERDLANPHIVTDANGIFQDTIWYDRLYNKSEQAEFDINFRNHFGMDLSGKNFIDFDSYDPSELSISYFSADELFNNGNNLVFYYGYTHDGEKIKGRPSFESFFSDTYEDLNGNIRHSRKIAPYQPNYIAGYIQDKFAFKDLVFNIGLRLDRFDANQKVLKDQYLLYEAHTAGEDVVKGLMPIDEETNEPMALPSNIGNDFVVYVDNIKEPTKILGFRDGSEWYSADGSQIDDPTLISAATGIAPYLINPDIKMNDDGYDPSGAFEDYNPQYTIMPRISFSFPISDVALFYAHYDILSKRPTSGAYLDPIQYFFINSKNSDIINNPNAKPEKTIDYELGFQQKLSNTSSLKLSAFYREMRDMQQVVRVVGAYPVNYMTYGNIDFGTVKGMTITYDLRRTGNVTLRCSYTLQFANGTGSNAESGLNLMRSNQPNLRTTIPLDFDQRHLILTTLDYRFASGRAYNGPKWFGKDVLQNTGANFVISTGSGSPFSRQMNITSAVLGGSNSYLDGSINGSRKPWRTTIDARVDRDISLKFGKDEDKKKEIYLNVYLEVQNVLNTKNILTVYRATGNPDDDGYLNAAEYQEGIQTQLDEQSFRNYYAMAVNSPYNYSLPRRIRLGLQLNF